MVEALSPYFLNPVPAAIGLGLVAAPILIHLINRLRYRRVEFAAMEFLLQSEQQNRRRVLLEQILLLLLRILAIVLLTLLIGRLVLDPSQLALFRGATLHQVVVLDDSLSTQERHGRRTAFDGGLDYVAGLVGDGDQPGQTKLTVYRTSSPQPPPGLSERTVNATLARDLEAILSDIRPSHQAADWSTLLAAIADRVADDPETLTTVHLVSDARAADWAQTTAIADQLEALETSGARITFVRTIDAAEPNLGLGPLEPVAAVGVPMRLRATLVNGGADRSGEVAAGVEVDGQLLPLKVEFGPLEPGQSETRQFDVVFEAAGGHEVAVTLPVDAVEGDNRRVLSIEVPTENPVLIVDSDPSGTGGQYVADALAADKTLTGFSPSVISPAELRRTNLTPFQSVFLVNTGRLESDAVDALVEYVSGGGGLVWFAGEQTRQADTMKLAELGLLPVALDPPADLSEAAEADLVASDDPIFAILAGSENPFLDVVDIRRYVPVAAPPPEKVRVLARLRNNAPLVLDHELGRGRVVTVLTSASSQPDGEEVAWNDWAGGPGAASFVVFVLELQQAIAKRPDVPEQEVGQPLAVSLDASRYRQDVEVIRPDGLAGGLQAVPGEDPATLVASFDDTDLPGVYRVQVTPQTAAPGDSEIRRVAFNVDVAESQMPLVDESSLEESLASLSTLSIRRPDEIAAMSGEDDRGGFLRALVIALVLTLLAEQLLAYRMGYHGRA